jgi:hypothetical protein
MQRKYHTSYHIIILIKVLQVNKLEDLRQNTKKNLKNLIKKRTLYPFGKINVHLVSQEVVLNVH